MKLNKVLEKVKKSKAIIWDRSQYVEDEVFMAVFANPMDILDFYVLNMSMFEEEKINTKCILNVLLIYKKNKNKK